MTAKISLELADPSLYEVPTRAMIGEWRTLRDTDHNEFWFQFLSYRDISTPGLLQFLRTSLGVTEPYPLFYIDGNGYAQELEGTVTTPRVRAIVFPISTLRKRKFREVDYSQIFA